MSKSHSIQSPLVSRLVRMIIRTSLLIPGAVLAAAPIGFDGWSVNNGVVDTSTSCSSGITCNTLVEDDGFLYQEIITPQGSFYRTIITDPGATGTAASLGFANETFIPLNNMTGVDISHKQSVRDPANGFDSTAIIDRDPFVNAAGHLVNPMIVDIDQTLVTDDFSSEFHLLQNDAVAGSDTYFGKSMDIFQNVSMATDTASDGFQAEFDLREREGWQISEVNNELALDPFSPAGSLTLGGAQVNWDEGERVRSTWMATINKDLATEGFAVQKIENLIQMTSTKQVELDAGEVIDPFAWDDNTFGSKPSLPDLPSPPPPP